LNYFASVPKLAFYESVFEWNYWHFSIRWETEDLGFWHKLNDNQKKKLAKRLGHEAMYNPVKLTTQSSLN
jgi:hypothetical protein